MMLISGEAFFTLFAAVTLLNSLALGEKYSLHSSDRDAIAILQSKLVNDNASQRSVTANPCTLSGVHCNRRQRELINHGSSPFLLQITRIEFNSRRLNGTLSPELGQLSYLRELSLRNNQISGRLPRQMADLRKLEILNLKNNRFNGEISTELSALHRLRILDLSSNRFHGNLNFLKNLRSLEYLSVADNHFSGKIPTSLRSFRNLRYLNFSGNEFLEGSVSPNSAEEFNSAQVSTNSEISLGNFRPESLHRAIFRFLAEKSNKSTISQRTNSASENSTTQTPSKSLKKRNHKKKLKKISRWILGFFIGGIAGSLSGLACSVIFHLVLMLIRGREKDIGPAIYSPFIKKAEDLSFLEKEEGVAMELIGRGGCGEVYKAELPGGDGKIIAIKKIIQSVKDNSPGLREEDSRLLNKKMRQIRSEINTVSKIRHRNLLPLLAHVSRPDCHYLVYEYMRNGSLQDVMDEVSEGRRELSWASRIRIAKGVAAGLEYLHTSQSPRIIHRDLKPANILLDDDMEARIADFGLAKAIPDADTHWTSSNVAGTIGYIAPEYHQTLKFTDKCDIYSFGVLLGVLVMGKLPSDYFFQNTAEMGMVKWLRNVMTSWDDPGRAIDAKLMSGCCDEEKEQMLLVLKIACFCTLDDHRQRPNSKDVRCMLAQIRR